MQDSTKIGIEKVGFWLTILCAIHCIATPILITFLPLMGAQFELFHQYENYILSLSFVLAIVLLLKDHQIHKNKLPLRLIAIAAVIKIIDIIFLTQNLEVYVSISIAALIVYAYWLNWKHKEKCNCAHSH
jgi:chromate transport protein ChrA